MKHYAEIELDGMEFIVPMYSATKGVNLLLKLAKIIGKPIATLVGEADGIDLEEKVTPELMMKFFSEFAESAGDIEVDKLIKEVIDGTKIVENGKTRPLNFDLDFRGKYKMIFRFIVDVLKFQYNDFLGELVEVTRDIQAPTMKIKAKKSASE